MDLISAIEKQIKERPNKCALVCDGRRYTYSDMGKIVDYVAHFLKKNKVQQGDVIGFITRRTELNVFLALAILNVGATYVPIDENLPEKRIIDILSHANIKTIVGDCLSEKLGVSSNFVLLTVNIQDIQELSIKTHVYKKSEIDICKPAVIIYTSGTTGTPKGVVLSHKCLYTCNKVAAEKNEMSFNDRVLLYLNFCFAFSLHFYQVLISGATLYIATDYIRQDFNGLRKYVTEECISTIIMPTQIGTLFCSEKIPSCLKKIIVGGGALPAIKKKLNCKIVSVYGSSECIFMGYHEVLQNSINGIIGLPVDGMLFNIALPQQQSHAFKNTGELLVSGDILSDGYLNNERLNHLKFAIKDGKKWYRTGDLVEILDNGEYRFIGRLDRMVKIDDYRIEIEEIEYWINQIESIIQTFVCVKEDNWKQYLCAYYVAPNELDDKIRSTLRKHLPDYMIPQYLIRVEKLPVNSNGKYDASQLALPKRKRVESTQTTSEIDKVVIKCVSHVLPEIGEINICDNFTDLGGTSLDALMLITYLREHKYYINLDIIKKAKNLKEVSNNLVATGNSVEVFTKGGTTLLNFSPYINYLIQSNSKEAINGFIIPDFYFCNDRISCPIVEDAVLSLLHSHYMLKAIVTEHGFVVSNQNGRKTYRIDEYTIECDLRKYPYAIESKVYELYNKIDVYNGIVFAVDLVHAQDHDYVLTACSHLVSDNYSKKIIRQDFVSALTQRIKGREISIPQTTCSYSIFCSFFKNCRQLALPFAKQNQIMPSRKYDTIHTSFRSLFYRKLNDFFRKNDIDIEAFFSYILTLCWYLITGKKEKDVIFFRHGRDFVKGLNGHIISFDRTFGFFSMCYQVTLHFTNNNDHVESMKSLTKTIRKSRMFTSDDRIDGCIFNHIPTFSINYLGEDRTQIISECLGNANYLPKFTYTSQDLNMYSPITAFIFKTSDAISLYLRYDSTSYTSNTFVCLLEKIRSYSKFILCN